MPSSQRAETIHIWNIKLPSGLRARVNLGFIVEEDGADTYLYAEDIGIKFLSIGEQTWEYDVNEFWLVPDTMNFEFYDEDLALYNRFFLNDLYQKRPVVNFQTETAIGSGVYETQHQGRVVFDTVDFQAAKKIISMTGAASTDVLNETLLYNDDGSARNPLGYTAPAIPPYPQHADPPAAGYPFFVNLKELIHDIFKLINPDIELEFKVNKKYMGVNKRTPGGGLVTQTNIAAEDIQVLTYYYFFNRNSGLSTVAEVLKELAFTFGCVAGLESNDKAFFRQFFQSGADTDNVTSQVLNAQTQLKIYPIRYVLITEGRVHYIDPYPNTESGGAAVFGVRQYLAAGNPPAYAVPNASAKSGIDDENMIRPILKTTYYRALQSDPNYQAYFSDFFWFADPERDEYAEHYSPISFTYGDQYAIHRAHRGSTEVFFCDDLAQTWYEVMRQTRHTQMVTLKGVDYSYVKNFSYQGRTYQPIIMRKNYMKNVTEVEGLSVSANSSHTEDHGIIPVDVYVPSGGRVVNEDLSAQADGTVAMFVTENEYEEYTLEVFRNGMKQTRDTDYTEEDNRTFLFTEAPEDGDILTVNYSLMRT